MPSLIAHRGVPGERPENSLPGFALALEQKADGIELDVHATRDGVIVVHHDGVLSSSAAPGAAIATLTWEEVRRVVRSPGSIPRLEEVLALVDGVAELFIEVKACGMEATLAPLLRGREQWCSVHSFDHRIPVQLAAKVPGMRTGILSCSYPLNAGELLRQTGARHFWQIEGLIDEALAAQVHDAGGALMAWTVNSAERAAALTAMGVDALCTDRPGSLRSELAHIQGLA